MADITSIDAAVPGDSERIRLGAQRIRETRAKLNEVITKVNELANVPEAEQEVYSRIQNIYVVDTTQATTITIPAGITSMEIKGCGSGGGGGCLGYAPNGGKGGDGGSGAYNYGTVAVAEGEEYSVVVGAGGLAGLTAGSATDGTYSRVTNVATSAVIFEAPGGAKGTDGYYDGSTVHNGSTGGSGVIGTYVPAQGSTYGIMGTVLGLGFIGGGSGTRVDPVVLGGAVTPVSSGSQGYVAITLRG